MAMPTSPLSQAARHLVRRPLPLGLELLESRDVPSAFYDLTTIASTQGGVFERFGDLVSINSGGSIAFVGYTDTDNDGRAASGLWVDNNLTDKLTNINPRYSDNPNRDFGRAVAMNDQHVVVARERANGIPAPFFVRRWDGLSTAAEPVGLASANHLGAFKKLATYDVLDYGRFSTLQTFTAINNTGDVAYLGATPDGRGVFVERRKSGNTGESETLAIVPGPPQSVPRPQITDDGRVLYRATDSALILARGIGDVVNVLDGQGFTKVGFAPGVSGDGRVVVFTGNRGAGPGVFAAVNIAGSWAVVRVAGERADGWTDASFDETYTDAVRVNSTLVSERGVTVAFEAVHPTVGAGLYTARVSFFGESAADFKPNIPRNVVVSGASPVALLGEKLPGGDVIDDVELWNGVNDRNRGELAFWARTADGAEVVVRARPTPVLWVDFVPYFEGIDGYTAQNLKLLEEVDVRVAEQGWMLSFDGVMSALNYTGNAATLRTAIVDQVQAYFAAAETTIRVLGRAGESAPAFVTYTTLEADSQGIPRLVERGAYQKVQVGGAPDKADTFGAASRPYGLDGLDFFNQTVDDMAVVFADYIYGYLGLNGRTLSSLSLAEQARAVARLVAHEAGHNFGLAHLETASNDDLMNHFVELVAEFLNPDQAFRNTSVALSEVPGQVENSRRRLWFAAGGPEPGDPPSPLVLRHEQFSLYSMPASLAGSVVVQRLVVGVVGDEDQLPAFYDLGAGDLATLLAAARLPAAPGSRWLLLGTTDGVSLDIVAVPGGQTEVLTGLDVTRLGLALDVRIRGEVGMGPLSLYRLTTGGPVAIGTVGVQGVSSVALSMSGFSLDRGGTFGLGTTRRGGGPLTRTLTIRNAGTDALILGTVTATGAGYSVTQPASLTLAPGAETTFTVTLSSATPGISIAGTLNIPSNDPAGPFVLQLRGDVTAKPDVLAVTRLDDPAGKLVVVIDFSEQLQPGPANDARNFALVFVGQGLPLATAVYSETGGVYRVTLTSAASGPFNYGRYAVRFNGTAIRSLSGTPAVTPTDQLLVEVGERNEYVTIGLGADGQLGVDGGPNSFGTAPSKWIDGADFNGDGLYDLVTTSAQTSEVVLFYGQPEGGFGPAERFTVAAPADRESRPGRAVAYDWDRNGTTDLVVWDNATGLTGQYWGGRFPRVVVYLNDGRGHFSVAPDMPIPLPENVMWQEGSLAVGPYSTDGSTAIALTGDATTFGIPGSIHVISKDPFVGYSESAVLSNSQAHWTVQHIESADFNGDGRPDLLANTAGYYIANPGPTLNLSTPTGYASVTYLGTVARVNGSEVSALGGQAAVGDFNGDGKPDLVVFHSLADQSRPADQTRGMTVLTWSSAAGRVVPLEFWAFSTYGSVAAVADLNRDGRSDLLFVTGTSVLHLYSNGDGTFRVGSESPLAPSGNVSPGNFVIRDVTGDGFPDALFGNTVGGRTGLLTNDTTGVLRTTAPAGPDVGLFTEDTDSTLFEPGLLTGDLNRDGLTDVIRVESGFGIYLADAGGGYRLAGTLPQPTGWTVPQPQWGLLGDLNGDRIPDLVVQAGPFEPSSALAWVWLGNGDGTFRLGPAVAARDVNSGGAHGTLADVNGDGRLDMVVWLPNIGTQSAPNGFAVWFGDGAGKLTYNPNTEVSGIWAGENYFSVVPNVFDATGDGVPDVVTRRVGTTTELAVYPGRGNGTFDTPVLTAGDPGLFFVPLDYNQDGVTDLVGYGTTTGGSVNVLAGIGGGRFAASVSLGSWTGYRTTRVVVGDFNQDGNPDVAVSLIRWLPGTPETKVLVLNGDGSGGFTTTTLYTGGQHSPRYTGLGAAGDGPEALAESDLIAIPGDGWVEAGSVTPPLPPAPPAPPAGQPLSVTTTQGKPVRVVPPSVPGISQLIAVDAQPAHGVVRIDDNGTPNNPGDDLFVYTPAPGYVGPDVWSYVAGNAGGAVSGEVSVTIAPGPQFRFDAVQYTSGYADANVVVRIIRSGDTASATSVLLRRTGGTLPAGELSELPDQITFAPGETEKELILSRNRVFVSGTIELALVAPDSTVGLGSPGAATVTFRFPPVSGYAVYGYAFRDRNDDSARGPGEELAGARVYIDANQNGRLDTGETTAFSDADGFFVLDLPIPGTFHVRANHPDSTTSPAGWVITANLPGSGFRWDIGFPNSSFPTPNTPPTVSDIPDLTLAPGAISGTVGFTVGDAETPANFLQVTAKSDNPALVAGVTITGSGGNKTVLVVPTYGQSGTAVVTVTVRDEGGLTASDTFVVTVPPVGPPPTNTPPTISDIADRTIGAGGLAGPIPFTVNDLQTPSSGLTVDAWSDNPALVPVAGLVLGGFGPSRTLTITPTAGATGSAIVTVSVTDAGGLTATDTFTVTVLEPPLVPPTVPPVLPPVVPPTVPPVIPPVVPPTIPPGGGPVVVVPREFAAGADRESGAVQFYNPDGSLRFGNNPFGSGFTGGVRVAAADFNRDGVADVVAGTGPGRATRVVVLDGKTQQELFAVDPFEPAFTGGVYVAAGDVTGDGVADLVITPDEGGGPRVRVFSGVGFGQLADFFGIDDPNFRGGARAAVGDLNRDGVGDLLVSAGFGGGPRVAGFDGRTLTGDRARLFGDFFAFEETLRNGIYLAAGDLDGDGKAELVAGGGPGGGPRVSTFSGSALLAGNQVRTADFFAGDTANRGGVRVAVKDLDGDDRADLVVGAGTGAGSRVTAYLGGALTAGGTPAEAFGFDAFPGFSGGVFVG